MEKISWTDHVRNEEVLLRVKEQRNILHEIRKRKANWTDHILRRNCLLQRVIEGKIKGGGGIEVTGRRVRKRRKLLDDLKERRGYSHLKEEALDRTMWRARFERGYGPVVRQTAKLMNIETCLKRDLDRAESYVYRKAYALPRSCNLTSSTCFKRSLPSAGKKFRYSQVSPNFDDSAVLPMVT
jgi:hypothetical protein